jgi:hypothetical protein
MKLLDSELKYYQSQGADKEMINPDIIKNLIEILNFSTLLKLVGKK